MDHSSPTATGPDALDARGTESLAVDFANTVACPSCRARDGLSTSADLVRWLAAHPRVEPWAPRPEELAPLRHFRETVRSLLQSTARGEPPDPKALARLNRAISETPLALTWTAAGWRRSPASETEGLRRAVGRLAAATAELLTGPRRDSLRACHAPDCAHFLLARTRGQIWCSPTGCGNRARVARHYWKEKGRPAARRRTRSANGSAPGSEPGAAGKGFARTVLSRPTTGPGRSRRGSRRSE